MPDAPDLVRLAAQWAADPTTTLFAPLADALRKRGELTRAAELALQGTKARPDFLPGWVVLAAISTDLGDTRGASEAIKQALRLDPGHPLVRQLATQAGVDESRSNANAPPADFVPPPVLEAPLQVAAPLRVQPQAGADLVAIESIEPDPDPEIEHDDLMFGDEVDQLDLVADAGQLASMSLASLYQGQGHLELAVQVLDALLARDPGDLAALARRDAIRAELDSLRPPSYRASLSGGRSVREWLAGIANSAAPTTAPASSFDAFYQPPTEPAAPKADDFAAFQSWLKELER